LISTKTQFNLKDSDPIYPKKRSQTNTNLANFMQAQLKVAQCARHF